MLKTKIPVRHPHVRQFIMARFGAGTPTIALSKKSLLGILAEMASEKIGFRHVLPKTEVDENRCIVLEYPESLKSNFIHPVKALVRSKPAAPMKLPAPWFWPKKPVRFFHMPMVRELSTPWPKAEAARLMLACEAIAERTEMGILPAPRA